MQSTEQQKRGIPDDEIDFNSIGRRISSFVVRPFRLMITHWLTTLAFMLCAVILAITLKYITPKSYRSSFIIRPNDRLEKFHLRIIGDLQVLLKEHNYREVSRLLALDSNVVKKIGGIKLHNPFLKHPADSLNSTEVLLVSSDPSIFLQLQGAIINYLENSPYFSKVRKLQEQQIAFELKETDMDLRRLDSLKNIQLNRYAHDRNAESGLLLTALMNPAAAYTVSTEKMARRSGLMAREAFLNNFQLVKECAMVKHHFSPPRILVMCLYLVPVSLILCAIFLIYKSKRRSKATTSGAVL
jgi:hypothetical protein